LNSFEKMYLFQNEGEAREKEYNMAAMKVNSVYA
jgi:hypothetical protein